jgi:imidazolonepropionase-like amidohydrolase
MAMRSLKWVGMLLALTGALTSSEALAKPLALVGGTVIDGTGQAPIPNGVVILDGDRIVAVGRVGELSPPRGATVVDTKGKYIIPGLMDANVHLFLDVESEVLIRYDGHYEDLILEAAQVALKNGLTTVFDTWGPRQELTAVKRRIAEGRDQGSRIFLAGNIVGFDGPISEDFFVAAAPVIGQAYTDRLNAMWVQGTGRDLLYLAPETVGERIAKYLRESPVDFVKYASSGHVNEAFIAFSPASQKAIVDTTHAASLTAQAHTTSIESLRLAIDAGVDLVQHCDSTGPVPIPASTIAMMVDRKVACAAMIQTQDHLGWAKTHNRRPGFSEAAGITDVNDRNLIRAGATLLLTTDSGVFAPSSYASPILAEMLSAPDLPTRMGDAHFLWLKAASELGMSPMDALQAATSNIAKAYGKSADLGTVQPGKLADLVVLNADPLANPANYRAIAMVIENGAIVDRDKLPVRPVLTTPAHP